MKYRKETWIEWGGDARLASTDIKAEDAKTEWECGNVFLLRIEATNRTRKKGEMIFTFSTERCDGLRDSELRVLDHIFDRWSSRFENVAQIWSLRSDYVFVVDVSKGKGFIETVVELVSEFAKELNLDNYEWFCTRFKMRQETCVCDGEQWVEFTKYMLSKYPVQK